MVVLKNCEPKLSYILLEFFNIYLKEYCFPGCWKVSSVVPVFKNVEETCTTKNYRPASLLSVVNKVLKNFSKKALLITYRNVTFFQISIMLGLLVQLQIF